MPTRLRTQQDGYLAVFEGLWAGYELSVTRALGHKNMEQYGVLDDPYVTVFNVEEEKHKCLVIASDGIWWVPLCLMKSAFPGCFLAALCIAYGGSLGKGPVLRAVNAYS